MVSSSSLAVADASAFSRSMTSDSEAPVGTLTLKSTRNSILFSFQPGPSAKAVRSHTPIGPTCARDTHLLAVSQQLLNGLGKRRLEVEELCPFGRDADSRHSWV